MQRAVQAPFAGDAVMDELTESTEDALLQQKLSGMGFCRLQTACHAVFHLGERVAQGIESLDRSLQILLAEKWGLGHSMKLEMDLPGQRNRGFFPRLQSVADQKKAVEDESAQRQ
jgi:hypothetical protein